VNQATVIKMKLNFTTKMVTYNVFKNLAFLCLHLLIWWQRTAADYDTSDSFILPYRCQ